MRADGARAHSGGATVRPMRFDRQRADYDEALGWVAALMGQTGANQLDDETPCAEFSVRELMGHVLGTARRSLGTAEGSPARDVPHVVADVPDEDLAATFAGLAQRIGSAWSGREARQSVTAPWGPCTAIEAVQGFTVETVVHGWDLAVATGQPQEAVAPVAERCLAFAHEVVPRRLRGVMHDEPIRPDVAIPPTERLANLLGHHR